MRSGYAVALLAALFACLAGGAVWADLSVRPGKLVMEEPTIHCLGMRWYVSGDENGNAKVLVSYRRKGEREWRQGQPLFRVGNGPDNNEGEARLEKGETDSWPFPLGNLFAGSIFDLKPDTEYEIKLALSDSDGGVANRILTARTRRVPAAPSPRRVLYVVLGDGGGTGTQSDPLRGLAAANAAARPGDQILVHAGVYSGTFVTDKSGSPQAPIVWQGAGDGEAVVDGQGGERAASANDVQSVFFVDLSFRNAGYGMVAHGAKDLVVQRCHFYGSGYGFTAGRGSERGIYIADNVIEGLSTWPTKGPKGDEEDRRGVQIGGAGHDVCYNRVSGFGKVYGDGIDIVGPGPNRAIDFYNNDISECTDDAIELDTGWSNVRAFRNRVTNCFEGISTQPVYGGPAYVFRNAMYNLDYTPFKMHNNSQGMLYFHNTIVKRGMPWPLSTSAEVRNAVSCNNLFIGTQAEYAMEFTAPMVHCDFDYDGFGGGPFDLFAKWNDTRYATFDEFRARSGIEQHAALIDPATAFASGVLPPQDYSRQFPAAVNDLRLGADSAAIDAGVPLPNLNDGYRGKAPDLGAYEYGEEYPWYGPRPRS
jgi:hypothetical protein